MKIKLLVLLLATVLCVAAADVDPEGPFMAPEFNREQKAMTVTVYVYDTHEQVTEAKRRLRPQDREVRLLGWSTWSDPPKKPHCDLHVARADQYMDKEFEVWGHELAHCLYGNYHKELDAAQ